jgi:hypothetical protein
VALTSATAVFCFVRAIPVLVEGWQFVAESIGARSVGAGSFAPVAVVKVSVRKTA